MRKPLFFILGLLACFFLTDCIKIKSYPNTPVITLKSISGKSFKQGTGPISLVFSFTDGDGDLGLTQTDTTKDVFIKDIRTGVPTFPALPYDYRMPNVTPDGNNKAISGEVQIDIPNTYCRPGLTIDSLVYTIQIKDRAGNLSNVIETPKIAVFQ